MSATIFKTDLLLTVDGQRLEYPKADMQVVAKGDYEDALEMLNKVLAFFNPSHDRPEAAKVYCEAFNMVHGRYPPAWKLLK